MPLRGSVHRLGETCSEELRLMFMLLAIWVTLSPQFLGAGAIERVGQFRCVELLLHMHVHQAGDV